MLSMLSRYWWLLAIRGVAAIGFGVIAFLLPGDALATLILLFAAYALVDGASMLISLAMGDATARRHAWSVGIIGVLGVLAGIITFLYPSLTALTLAYLVAYWAIAIGVFQIVAAIRLRKEIQGELWMGLGGVLAILFGAYVIIAPGAGLLSLLWLLAAWAILFGLSSLALAWKLRGLKGPMATAMGRA